MTSPICRQDSVTCCHPHAAMSKKVHAEPALERETPDQERGIQALSNLKLYQVKVDTDPKNSIKVGDLLRRFNAELTTASEEEINRLRKGMTEIFWNIGIALAELHTDMRGVDDIYDRLLENFTTSTTGSSKTVQHYMDHPAIQSFLKNLDENEEGWLKECIEQDSLEANNLILTNWTSKQPIRGAFTFTDVDLNSLSVQLEDDNIPTLFLSAPEVLVPSLNSKGEGTGCALLDAIRFLHNTIESQLNSELPLHDIASFLTKFLQGYRLGIHVRLQDYVDKEGLDAEKTRTLVESIMPSQKISTVLNYQVVLEKLAKSFVRIAEASTEKEAESAKRFARNTLYTLYAQIKRVQAYVANSVEQETTQAAPAA